MNEPSVLDYIKALLTPWKGKPPQIPPLLDKKGQPSIESIQVEPVQVNQPPISEEIQPAPTREAIRVKVAIPWRTGAALLACLIAQMFLTASKTNVRPAVIFYAFGVAFFVLAIIEREWVITELQEDSTESMPLTIRQTPMLVAAPLALLAFIAFGDKITRSNHFSILNLILWLATITALTLGLYLPNKSQPGWIARAAGFLRRPEWSLRISRYSLISLAAIALVVFFRLFRLNQVPYEMFSDHAEKLLDVMDVLSGKLSVFFPRNTGREAFQMYLTALVSIVFDTKISFLSLKIGTALAGLFALPYIYLLGKEVGGKRVGLMALTLAGIAYWPNVISRVGLRFPLYPLFAAPALYYLIRGLRYRRRNDFIWSGIALGIGLHGYSPMRWLPFVLVIVLAIYLLHRHSRGNRSQSLWGLLGLAVVALVLFIPFLRYALANPDMFSYRMLSRIGTAERAYPGSVGIIFLTNLWKSLVMFFYDNGNVWVNSIPGRPALDTITAVLFFIGCLLLIVRYIRQRHWLDLTLLLLVPLLMMTSIFSLAFPDENPSLNRSGAAIIPVFIIAAFGFDAILRTFLSKAATNSGKIFTGVVAAVVLMVSIISNYQLVFGKYNQQFENNAWNTSQIGQVIQDYAGSQGSLDTAYVIPYPYWVDTRLVGMRAGVPEKDYALQRDQIEATLSETREKLFIFNTADTETAIKLESFYPLGSMYRYSSGTESKDFMMYYVPPVLQ